MEIQIGLDQLNRGEGIPLDMDEINHAIDKELGKRTARYFLPPYIRWNRDHKNPA